MSNVLPMFKDGVYGFFGEYRFLSNFWYVDVVLDGEQYPTVEHAYQAAKTNDPSARGLIRAAATPGIAKRMGKSVSLRPDWEAIKVEIMRDLIEQKFARSDLRGLLLATGDKYLEETNTWGDTFWGVCNGRGFNGLGSILMYVRSQIREQANEPAPSTVE